MKFNSGMWSVRQIPQPLWFIDQSYRHKLVAPQIPFDEQIVMQIKLIGLSWPVWTSTEHSFNAQSVNYNL